MGSPLSEADRGSDEVQHTVTLTQGFWMSDHEATQAEYQLVMGSNPSVWKGESLPVETVSWDDAVAYCKKLTERERAAGRITAQQAYRLPTEAEWEYAARAGTTGVRYGELAAIGWYNVNSGRKTHPVSQKAANAWGLHDMIGNVWEWCSDWYGDYPTGSVTDPTGPSSGSFRVNRGGSWNFVARGVRSAFRGGGVPGDRGNGLGFRPVLSSVR
jgi:formylglycine-generating enzyme required for sulfatase activity